MTNKKVLLTTGVSGDEQMSSFQNATLQTIMTGSGCVDVSISVHIDPPDMWDEVALGEWVVAGLDKLPDGFVAEVQISDSEEA